MVPRLWSFQARSLTFIALAGEERSVFLFPPHKFRLSRVYTPKGVFDSILRFTGPRNVHQNRGKQN
jgi:hypothetical protein